ncbi:hypothetical protein EFP84_10835 [Leptospira kmetyi]|uniref:Uncharacterized protein n=1 Tax=Leptospira kmetyi TaxID=408139 RepID=A0AAD0UP48_9LEPT|nr:hypothetical protein EFP84_10835 [Leptospira kmetyi]
MSSFSVFDSFLKFVSYFFLNLFFFRRATYSTDRFMQKKRKSVFGVRWEFLHFKVRSFNKRFLGVPTDYVTSSSVKALEPQSIPELKYEFPQISEISRNQSQELETVKTK